MFACSEQGKLPAAKAFTLAERDKHMSEQKLTYMQQLDQWAQSAVIDPLLQDCHELAEAPDETAQQWQQHLRQTVAEVKRAIREKVLESYRNGQGAGPRPERPARKETKHAQAQAR